MSSSTKLDPDVVTTSTKLAQRGLLSEADALLNNRVLGGGAQVLERLEWIKIAALMGEHAEALKRLCATKDIEQNVDWSALEAELLIRSRSFPAAVDLIEGLRISRSAPLFLKSQEEIARTLANIQSTFAGSELVEPNYTSF